MNQYNNLLTRISNTLGIKKGTSETEEDYKARIIYSAIGVTAFASLWDTFENNEPVSIVHMKRRIEMLLQDYKELYPKIAGSLTFDASELSTEMYDIFRRAGVIYHEPNRIAPAIKKTARNGDVVFLRACLPGDQFWMSGLGTYRIDKNENSDLSLKEMFQIDETSLSEQWKQAIEDLEWSTANFETSIEFLNTQPQRVKGYWVDKPLKTGAVSLCRTSMNGSRLYYFYKQEKEKLLVSQIPEWQLEFPCGNTPNSENHRHLTNACLAANGVLPPSQYHVDGEIVSIKIGYLMPPTVMAFLNLYSWPASYASLPQNFRRVCSLEVFKEILAVLEPLGYEFIKE